MDLHNALPPHPPVPPRPSASSDILLSQLAGDSLDFRTHPQHADPTFAIYKTAIKCRFILDLRAYNKLFLCPTLFRLPTFSALLQSPSFPLYFMKLDVTNFRVSFPASHRVRLLPFLILVRLIYVCHSPPSF